MTTHEVLVAARNLIDREGWLQHQLGRPGRGYCAVGGLCYASGRIGDKEGYCDETHAAAQAALGSALRGADIVDFNNAPGRTKEEVLAAFDRAIAQTAPPPPDPFPAGTPEAGVEAIDREPAHA